MKDHPNHPIAERLQGFVEKTLDSADFAVVESHLVDCRQCQAEVEEWRSLFAMLATMPQLAPSPKFAEHVMAHITLPDPWYARAVAKASEQIRVFTPRTSRGWAFAAASFSLPLAAFSALVFWMMSKPYLTPQGMVAFAYERVTALTSATAGTVMGNLLQSDVALFFARGLETLSHAGLGAAGALFGGITMTIALSAWFLYQNLFRTTATRKDRNYASYSF